jgi:hypothetical protein
MATTAISYLIFIICLTFTIKTNLIMKKKKNKEYKDTIILIKKKITDLP